MWSRRAIQAISALLTLSACATADQDNAISTYVSTQATSLGGGKYDLRIQVESEETTDATFDARAESLCDGPFTSEAKDRFIVFNAHGDGSISAFGVEAVVTCISGIGRAERIPGSGLYSVSYGAGGANATLMNYVGNDLDAKLSAFVTGICGGPYRVVPVTYRQEVCRANCPVKTSAGVNFECENSQQ